MRRLILVFFVVVLVVTPGCKSEDVFASLGQASSYIGSVGDNMQAKGWSDFPGDAISLVRYVADLRASISTAKKKTTGTASVSLSDMGAMVAHPLEAEPEPPLRGLGDAFGRQGTW